VEFVLPPEGIMKRILQVFALAGAIYTVNGQGTFEAMSSYTIPAAGGAVSGTAGWAFQPTTTISVNSLGCLRYLIDGSSAQGAMEVGLWANNGTLLASTFIDTTNTAFNATLYAAISPVVLGAGNTYRVGIYSPSGTTLVNLVTQGVDGSGTFASDIQLLGAATGTSGFGNPSTQGASNTLLLGPNFQFTRTVPEPSTLALAVLGGLGWMVVRRRTS